MLLRVGIGVLGVALLVWGISFFWKGTVHVTELTAKVTRGNLPITVLDWGQLQSSNNVEIKCEVEGNRGTKITEIAGEGVHVTKGQMVVRFDADEHINNKAKQDVIVRQAEGKAKAAKSDLEVQKNKAASEIAKAELTLKLADLDKKKYLLGEYVAEVKEHNGNIALAKRELQEATEKLAHYRNLERDGFVSRDQVLLKEAEVKQREFFLGNKEEKLNVLEKYQRVRQEVELTAKAVEAAEELERTRKTSAASTDKGQSELEAAEVTVKIEQRALTRIEQQLTRCEIKAPQEGIVVYSKERYYDPGGGRIQPGALVHLNQILFTLPDLANMQVKVRIHESLLKKVAKGLKAEIRLNAFPGKVLPGTVESVATVGSSDRFWDENAPKEYITIVKMDDIPPEAGLRPGMSAEVKILVTELKDVLLIPVQAVTEKEGKHCVYVKNGKGFDRRAVSVGENNEKYAEIKSGLEVGEEVALDARARLAAETKGEEGAGEGPKSPTK